MPRIVGVDLRRDLENNPPPGLSPVRARLRRDALALMLDEDLVEASYCYEVLPLDAPPAATLHAGGAAFDAPALLPASGELTALGFAACTLGPRLQSRCTTLFGEKRASLAVALDELGTEMLFALARRLQDRVLSECYRKRLSLGAELNAGDPGLALDTLAAIVRLSGAADIGIGLHGGKLMTPLKSTAMIFAIGRDLPAVALSRCGGCPSRERCTFGRRPAAIPTPAYA
ncbi:MAG: hypothetical protein KKE51_01340 [Gammaproteobacteria bacterium]|nr:hypothetical protein [Gammaproteobacteria bacterium]MBU1600637.1 hypothetical protein [Gammaproteobacteria bacterium]MBU2435093.1 hypothetical protein [Gammaproteobacteria bacterium]MBU2448329.1 hypothetical protein [Gammaproteobacteria bacterium]